MADWDSFLAGLEDGLTEELSELTGANGETTAGAGDNPVEHTIWTPPADLGPLPARLEGRARAVATALGDAHAILAARHSAVARHLAAVQSVPPLAGGSRPVYLDVSG